MSLKHLLPLLIACLLLTSPVYALDKGTASLENVDSYSYESDDGYVVYEVIVGELPFGTNQSHVFYMDGAEWDVDVDTWTAWAGAEKHADVTITYPNGTHSTQSASVWSVFGTYQTVIQPVAVQSESLAFLKVDLQVGIDPAAASMYWDIPWSAQDAIAFDDVSGSFTGTETSDVYVYWISEDDFKSAISEYNPGAWWAAYAGDIFAWSWDMVQAIIGAIPVIGPLFLDVFGIMGIVLEQGFYWLLWIVNNFPAILLSVEALICLFAVINTPAKGRGGFYRLVRNLYMYNVLFVTGIVGIVMWVANAAKMLIDTILATIQALKPI